MSTRKIKIVPSLADSSPSKVKKNEETSMKVAPEVREPYQRPILPSQKNKGTSMKLRLLLLLTEEKALKKLLWKRKIRH
jgi:hypothetical protein